MIEREQHRPAEKLTPTDLGVYWRYFMVVPPHCVWEATMAVGLGVADKKAFPWALDQSAPAGEVSVVPEYGPVPEE